MPSDLNTDPARFGELGYGWKELETVDSGAGQRLHKSVPVSKEQEDSAVALEMSAGSLSIHDSFILHGSDENRSGRRRAGYTIRYCTDTALVDPDIHPHPVFQVRGQAGPRGDDRYTCLLPGVEAAMELLGKP